MIGYDKVVRIVATDVLYRSFFGGRHTRQCSSCPVDALILS